MALGLAPVVRAAAAPRQAAAPTSIIDPYALVDPELLPALKVLPKLILNADTLPAVPLPISDLQPVERRIPGPQGAPDVRILVIDPTPGGKSRPAYLHIHGGGYVSGSAPFFAGLAQKVARNCGCVVVSVDYRFAPKLDSPARSRTTTRPCSDSTIAPTPSASIDTG
jgi:acetyl esterase/lipase